MRCKEDVEVYGYTKKTVTVAQRGLAAMPSGVRAVMPGDGSSVGAHQLSLQWLKAIQRPGLGLRVRRRS